jgi:hypothetical protein
VPPPSARREIFDTVKHPNSSLGKPFALTSERTEPELSVQRIFRPFHLGLWGALGVLFLSSLAVGSGVGHAAAPLNSLPSAPATCAGSALVGTYNGTVSIVGGPLSASAAVGLSLSYNYSIELEISNRTTGILVSSSCEPIANATSSGPNGSFSLHLAIPSSRCFLDECAQYTGPYGPLAFGLSAAAPSGYESIAQTNGTSVSLSLIAEFGEIGLDPGGSSRVLSPSAPGSFTAEPLTALGAPSPLSPAYHWNLTGTGWSFDGADQGTNVTVEALPDSTLGALSVTASVTVGSNRFSAGPDLVDLESVPTAFTGGDANRTDLDVGGLVSFSVEGTGAPGYTYSALVSPGLEQSSVEWPCTEGP